MFFSTFFTAVLLATASVAAPINAPQELIVFSPHIISPKASVAWPRGSRQVVRWNTTGIPTQNAAATGLVLLGYSENGSENLDIDHPLASGFHITAGAVNVTMPKGIPARDNYFVVLFGDSGNKSPKFKIH
ncbi:hypothetical protein B0H34DRAFT_463300 [Crassisporium funariophilum]|nr:hypothetical protein B0H34DRAFT_463300 [Crassisporium funariophilum]